MAVVQQRQRQGIHRPPGQTVQLSKGLLTALPHLDQKLLQIQPDQLFSGKTGTFRTDQLFLVGIIHPSLKYMSGFLNDLRQKDPFRFADL